MAGDPDEPAGRVDRREPVPAVAQEELIERLADGGLARIATGCGP